MSMISTSRLPGDDSNSNRMMRDSERGQNNSRYNHELVIQEIPRMGNNRNDGGRNSISSPVRIDHNRLRNISPREDRRPSYQHARVENNE